MPRPFFYCYIRKGLCPSFKSLCSEEEYCWRSGFTFNITCGAIGRGIKNLISKADMTRFPGFRISRGGINEQEYQEYDQTGSSNPDSVDDTARWL